MPNAGKTHDYTLAENDGRNAIGMMSPRDRHGRRKFSIEDDQTILNRQLSMGELTEAELPATIEQVWTAKDWTLGIGGVLHRDDPRKVAITTKVDTSEPGIMRLARELRSTTLSSAPNNYEPSGFAIAPFDTGGTTALNMELWAFVGRDVYSGGDDNWTLETEPQAVDVYYRNGVQYGKYVVAPAWYGGSDAADCAMVYIYKDPTSADWTLSTLTAGRFKHFAKARNADGDEILYGANHIFDTSFTLSGDHTDSDTTLTLSGDPTATISVNDIVMMGAAGAQELMLVTATSAVDPHLTVVRGYGTAASDPVGGEKIYLYQPHVLKTSTDPSNSGSWSSATTIGQDDQPITGLAVDGDSTTVFVAKTDGVYSYGLDANNAVVTNNLTTEFRQFGHSGNFHGIYAWNGHVLLPVGTGGLLDMDIASGVIRDISLSVLAPKQTNLHGRVLAMHGDHAQLFMLVKDTDSEKLHLVMTKLVEFNGQTEFRYYALQEMGAGAAINDIQSALMIDTSLDDHRRVWIGFTESGVNEVPRFYPFGRVGDDQTDGFTDDTDASVVTVRFDKNLPNVPMHISSMELESNNLSAGTRKVDVDFRFDLDTNWVAGPSFTKSPIQESAWPEDAHGKILELRLKPSLSAVGTTSPEISGIRLKWQIQPDPRKLIPMHVRFADGMQLLNGATSSNTQKALAQLHEWNESPASLILGTPNKDHDRDVLLMPGTLKVHEVALEPGRRPEYEATFMLVEVGLG